MYNVFKMKKITNYLTVALVAAFCAVVVSPTILNNKVEAQAQSWRTPTAEQKPKLEKAGDTACSLRYARVDQQVLQQGCKEGIRVYAQNTKSITPQKACEKLVDEQTATGVRTRVQITPGCPQGFLLAAETLAGMTKKAAQKPDAVGKSGANLGKTKTEACKKYKNASNKEKCEKAFDKQKEQNKKDIAEGKKKQEIAASKDPALDCIENPDKCNLMKKYVNPIIGFLTAFVGIAVTIGIISGGIRMATSADDPSKLATGKKQIGTAIFALLAMMILYALIRWLTPSV